MIKSLMISTEVEPFAKTGGLGDVLGALPVALNKAGVDARVVMPKYNCIAEEYKEKMVFKKFIYVPLGWRSQYCGIFEMNCNGTVIYFLDNEFYFGGDGLYSHDDLEKFSFMQMAVLEILPHIDFKPDILHCNDWQAGMIPVLLDAHYRNNPFYKDIKTIITIHNLQYQGIFGKQEVWDFFRLDDYYFTSDKVEFNGSVNFLKAGITYADYIIVVSKTYAEEIKYPFFGERLEGILSARSNSTRGILNGIDYDRHNPLTDPNLTKNYSSKNFVSGKRGNKVQLQKKLGLTENEKTPMIGIVSRLVNQKGFDLMEAVMDEILELGVQIVVLGTGDPRYENMFRHYAWRYPESVSANITFDSILASQIYASSDMFLMPSLYEPCGLGQLISLRYGTIPIVREVGGLKDTITPYNEFTGEGNGFSFANYNAHEMLTVIQNALELYKKPKLWQALVRKALKSDFSWDNSANEYIEVYEYLLAESTAGTEVI